MGTDAGIDAWLDSLLAEDPGLLADPAWESTSPSPAASATQAAPAAPGVTGGAAMPDWSSAAGLPLPGLLGAGAGRGLAGLGDAFLPPAADMAGYELSNAHDGLDIDRHGGGSPDEEPDGPSGADRDADPDADPDAGPDADPDADPDAAPEDNGDTQPDPDRAGAESLPAGPTTLTLPNGDTVTAPSPQLAAAIGDVANGVAVPEAFQRQGMSIPPPGTPVVDPIDPTRLTAGDIGMFADRHAVALGDAKALLDGQIQRVEAVSGPSFLGWEHPPQLTWAAEQPPPAAGTPTPTRPA